MADIFAKRRFLVKMTGHKMLIVTDHFVLEVHGMSQHIPSDFLGNDHHGSFYLQGRLICFFYSQRSNGPDRPKRAPAG